MNDFDKNDFKNNLEGMFLGLVKDNQEWFNGIVNLYKTSDIKESPKKEKSIDFVSFYQKFCNNAVEYLVLQNSFYQEQMKVWRDFFQKLNFDSVFEHKDSSDIIKKEPNANSYNTKFVNTAFSKSKVDNRFSDSDWESNPFFKHLKQSYFAISDYLFNLVTGSKVDSETKERMQFFMHQYLDAISPTNFILTNPEVIKTAIETGGVSLVHGMQNMLKDLQNGYMAMTDEAQFEVGGNLAVTRGKVVYKNELMELIQYAPMTAKVYKIPLLIVPPFINKYYILDLQKYNSFVKYLVDSGYTVFLISWRSADISIANYKWEDYANIGVISAFKVISSITKQKKINALGYCIGGTILTIAVLLLKSLIKDLSTNLNADFINAMVHITTLLDHKEPGDIKYFIDRDLFQMEDVKAHGYGIMPGRSIAQTFSALRANELIWNYWVNNYLLGKKPEAFDILYWNTDVINLPLPIHSFLLKRLYIQNDLVSGRLIIGNAVMDLSKIDCPLYVFAARNDHIVPWQSAYKTICYVRGRVRFVLGASGHTAGVINPVSTDKRSYWVNDTLEMEPKKWLTHATEVSGSWWKDLHVWLSEHSGAQIKVRQKLGNIEFKPIADAPGEYVKIRV